MKFKQSILNYNGNVFFLQNNTWNGAMQPISDVFLPNSEQFLPNSLLVALSTSTQQTNIQIDVVLGATDLEALNYYGRVL